MHYRSVKSISQVKPGQGREAARVGHLSREIYHDELASFALWLHWIEVLDESTHGRSRYRESESRCAFQEMLGLLY